MTKSAIAWRHVAFEDLGCFSGVLRRTGFDTKYIDVGIDDFANLDPLAPDLLIVLGGPIGAYEDTKYPFLSDEITLLKARLRSGRPTIGICLGAQLIARALGSRVYPARSKEIGLAPISLTDEGHLSCLSVFEGGPVLHWHGDTFDIPHGAVRLAASAACDNQAFTWGPNVIAFQFHPEAGGADFERWLVGHAHELSAADVDVVKLRAEYNAVAGDMCIKSKICLEMWLRSILL